VLEKPKILGIDPGSRVVGFALIGAVKVKPLSPKDWVVLDVGVIRTSAELPMSSRLGQIHGAVFELLSEMSPQYAAIEKAFYGVNAATALKLGEARGSIMAAFSRCCIPVLEITPAEVKRIVAGKGAATKEQVYQSLQAILGFQRGRLPLDASDALAIAYASALSRMGPLNQTLSNLTKKSKRP
jgi:crossover junction endodeoxyribonuclease RuvC